MVDLVFERLQAALRARRARGDQVRAKPLYLFPRSLPVPVAPAAFLDHLFWIRGMQACQTHAGRRASGCKASTSGCPWPASALRSISQCTWRVKGAPSRSAWAPPRCTPLSMPATAGLHSQEPIAIDVEYAHLLMDDGSSISVAAWVCLVGPESPKPLLKTFCRHPILQQPPGAAGAAPTPAGAPAPVAAAPAITAAAPAANAEGLGGAGSEALGRSVKARPVKTLGGVRMANVQDAPSLYEVTQQVSVKGRERSRQRGSVFSCVCVCACVCMCERDLGKGVETREPSTSPHRVLLLPFLTRASALGPEPGSTP